MIKRAIIQFLGSVTLVGCITDEDQLRIVGTVLTYDTKQEVPSQKIVIELGDEIDISNDYSLTNLKKDSTMTDQNGNFRFNFPNETRKQFRLKLENNGFVRANEPPVIASIIDNRKLIIDTLLVGKSAGLKLFIKNDDPTDGDSYSFNVVYKNPYSTGLSFFSYSSTMILGMGLNPNDYKFDNQFLFDLNKEVTVSFSVVREGEPTNSNFTIKLKEKETVEYTIEF